MDTPLQRKSKTDTFTRKLKRNIQRTEPPILRMETGTILIVDDNKSVLASLELLLENVFSTVRTAANPNQITTILSTTPIDIVILDMNFSAGINNGNEGLYWLKHIHEIRPSLPVIMLTAYGDVELAVKALKNGATDFLLKPWDNHILIQKIKEAYQNNRPTHHKNSPKSTQKASGDENLNKSEMLIGHSPAMLQLIKVVTKVAKTDANILITGENGTGKEMLAREIHRLSSRNTRQLLSVDMGAISESLFESELFGHERGAFTDAYESRPGKFEAANGGSLFMDEIGNLPLALQAKLLTVLQNRNITRIGSNKVIPVDIRLISATNKDLEKLVEEGSFRRDLYYRLNVVPIRIPSLAERTDDIPALVSHFLEKYGQKFGVKREIDDNAIEYLKQQQWPGNIRELENMVQRLIISSQGETITLMDVVKEKHGELFEYLPDEETDEVQQSEINLQKAVEEYECGLIKYAYEKYGSTRKAAKAIGISQTQMVRKKKKYNL